MATDLENRLALWRAPGIGPVHYSRLTAHFGSAEEVIKAPPSALERFGLGPGTIQALSLPNWSGVERDLRWARQDDHHILAQDDPRYPRLLREIPNPPPVLFVVGVPESLSTPQLAIVGSRNASPGGKECAWEFAYHLARAGLSIISGLAVGVDSAGHRGALEAQGITIAVLANGLDQIYPARHRELADQITTRGALVSELPLGSRPLPAHFPQRNRIISGLSLGVLVVEAARRSGSLITAHLAAEQGREVFSIPGSIQNPLARGCHQLIRSGAKLVETASDIFEELNPLVGTILDPSEPPTPEPQDLATDDARLLECMGYNAVAVDTLVERTGLTPEAVSSMLLMLELKGLVAAETGGRYLRLRPRSKHEA